LLYAFYNFIIDIDFQQGKFIWVKYKKEHKLNLKNTLAKMFLNNGYIRSKSGYRDISVSEIHQETTR